MGEDLTHLMEPVATALELFGVAVIVLSVLLSTAGYVRDLLTADRKKEAYDHYRANLGRGILLGLELLVAADIIGTVAVTPSMDNLTVLGLIVLIRTFLSFALEVEIEGRWPWRRAEAEVRGQARDPRSGI